MEYIKKFFIKLSQVDYDKIIYSFPCFQSTLSPSTSSETLTTHSSTSEFNESELSATPPSIQIQLDNIKQKILNFYIYGIKQYYNIYFYIKNLSIVNYTCKIIENINLYIGNYFYNKINKNPDFDLRVMNLYNYIHEKNKYFFEEDTKELIIFKEINKLSTFDKQYLLTTNYLDVYDHKFKNKYLKDSIIILNDKYIYVCQDNKITPDYIETVSKIKFIFILYINNKTNQTSEILLNDDYYISGNALFTPAFVYKCLKNNNNEDMFYIDNYTIKIIDNSINKIEINNNEYIELKENSYMIKIFK